MKSAIFFIVLGLVLACKLLFEENRNLKSENEKLKKTIEVQENIVKISDESHAKNATLNTEITKKINYIKSQGDIKNTAEFIEKSNCIFNNFGSNYEC